MNKRLEEMEQRLQKAEAALRQQQRRLERLRRQAEIEQSRPHLRMTVGNGDLARAEREVDHLQAEVIRLQEMVVNDL